MLPEDYGTKKNHVGPPIIMITMLVFHFDPRVNHHEDKNEKLF